MDSLDGFITVSSVIMLISPGINFFEHSLAPFSRPAVKKPRPDDIMVPKHDRGWRVGRGDCASALLPGLSRQGRRSDWLDSEVVGR